MRGTGYSLFLCGCRQLAMRGRSDGCASRRLHESPTVEIGTRQDAAQDAAIRNNARMPCGWVNEFSRLRYSFFYLGTSSRSLMFQKQETTMQGFIASSFKAAALACAILAGSAVHAQDIPVGYNSDMSATGSAEFGLSARYGIEEAARQINAAGGLLGRKLVVISRDDVGQPPKAIQNTNELINNEKVATLFGSTNSGNMLAWLHIPQQKKIPSISPSASATEITKRYEKTGANYIYRVSMIDRDQIALLLAYAVKASKNGKIAFIVDSTGYGQQALKDLRQIMALHGKTAVAEEKFGPNDTDMTSQLNKIKASGADTLIVYALADANAHVMLSMQKINYFPLTLGSFANINSPFINISGAELAGKMIFAASTTEDSNARAADLAKKLKAHYKRVPAFVTAAQGYDGMMIWAEAVRQAGTTDGEKVQQALDNLQKPVQGVIKTYDHPFSKTNHEALSVRDFHLARWDAGRIADYHDAVLDSLTAADFKK
jgi:branched-chain amino acid transport system substrate-binding protein